MSRRICLMLFITVSLVIVSCCGKKIIDEKKEVQKSASPEALSLQTDQESRAGNFYGRMEEKDADTSAKEDDSLNFTFMPQTKKELIKGRYLEYIANLTYRTAHFAESRLELLNIIEKYGFLVSASANAELSASMNVQANIKAESLYLVIKELERVGALVSENITVSDHTGERVWASIKADREKIRVERKNKAIGQITAAKRTWEGVEASLEASEDAADQAEYQEWSINDLVSWAKFNIQLEGPKKLDNIQAPDYRKAGILLLNFLIRLSYYLLIASPFIVSAVIVLWKRKAILGLLKKKEKRN